MKKKEVLIMLDKDKQRIWKLAILSFMILVTLIILIWLRNEITLAFLYPYLRDKLVSLNVNIWLAKLVALPLTVWILVLTHLLFSRNKEKKKLGYILGGATWVVWCLCMFIATRDNYINPQTGEGTRCFAQTPTGYRERPCLEKFDPTFGTEVVQVDQNIALSEWVKRHGPIPVEKIEPTKDMVYFTADGRPMYWYYEHPNGQIDLFNRPGSHPQFGVELHPLTAEVVVKIFKQIEAKNNVNIVVHKDDGSVDREASERLNLNHLQDLSDSLKSIYK